MALNPSSYGNQITGVPLNLPSLFKSTNTASNPPLAPGQPRMSIAPQSMGQKAITPNQNTAQPSNTLPKNQVASPVSTGTPNPSTISSMQNTLNGIKSNLQTLQDQQNQGQGPYSTQTSYGQYTAGLANTPQGYSPTTSNLANQLATSYQNNPDVQKAIQNIKNLQTQYADTTAQIGGTPGLGQQEAQGEQGLLSNLFAAKMGAAQTALQNALKGLGYQQAGLTQAGTLTTNEQQLNQQALAQAAGYAQPTYPSYSNAVYNPTTGQFETVGGGQYGTGPAAGANVQSIQDQQQQLNTMTNTYSQTQNLESQLSDALNSGAINPSDATFLNQATQWFQKGQLGDPKYQNAINLMNDLVATYAQVLGVTGNPTNDKLAMANSLINQLASGQSIQQVMAGLDAQMEAKIRGVQTSIQNISSGKTGTNTFGTGGQAGNANAFSNQVFWGTS